MVRVERLPTYIVVKLEQTVEHHLDLGLREEWGREHGVITLGVVPKSLEPDLHLLPSDLTIAVFVDLFEKYVHFRHVLVELGHNVLGLEFRFGLGLGSGSGLRRYS